MTGIHIYCKSVRADIHEDLNYHDSSRSCGVGVFPAPFSLAQHGYSHTVLLQLAAEWKYIVL